MPSKRVLGIDPGTGICGFGVVEFSLHKQPHLVTAGVITTPAHTALADRLLDIYDSLKQIIEESNPDEISIEKLYFNQNIFLLLAYVIEPAVPPDPDALAVAL